MRVLNYNIRYATGIGPGFHFPLPLAGYLRSTAKNLDRITRFIETVKPDLVGLTEVDMGSFRTSAVNQAEYVANALGHFHSFESKYADRSLNTRLPVVKKQGNAILTSQPIVQEHFHYFDAGIKRLILEIELDDVVMFLVHLSVKYRHRHYQLRHLHSLVGRSRKPVIVAGDFNTFWGDYEMHLFMEAAGLKNVNVTGEPTYPSWAPSRQLDFILYGQGLEVSHFEIPDIRLSDHLPLVCDFRVIG
ncbi:endonuclease/exonuclease/phosphatase family metal-dependent hydrolase [Natronospira proteinivora]|uniref:Endonuclease/exonuclease/phosphatase family metal-dependent hydrolase n=1 Tax=Natronospira proteinivora TaxID=1807133 RepID=A0ABT1G6Z0_9GAMM|nr:endonuclease/exonuclease/phosphatase family protein [Natronospira proteinivora]MCP1726852.1 endonuclease/exonuclease/phosphatase family metal-dependent hydrolase [Natronospira proteinivora]